jgi:hypothetical protein
VNYPSSRSGNAPLIRSEFKSFLARPGMGRLSISKRTTAGMARQARPKGNQTKIDLFERTRRRLVNQACPISKEKQASRPGDPLQKERDTLKPSRQSGPQDTNRVMGDL